MTTPDIASISFLRDLAVESCKPLSGGGNNRVFKLALKSGETRLLKYYFSHPSDKRDRLGTEFNAFTLLWEKGIRCIPQPLAKDPVTSTALYSFIDGERINCTAIGTKELDEALSFARRLKVLSREVNAINFPNASEACFSLPSLNEVLSNRLKKLTCLDKADTPAFDELTPFLHKQLIPFLNTINGWAQTEASRTGILISEELSTAFRTLSPSDFGFHNAIKLSDGSWIFQDFEYFGWDDPVKLISDFLIHPAMQLAAPLQSYFARNGLTIFSDDPGVGERLKIYFPFFGVKWCIILLNEFVPEFRARRGFASAQNENVYDTQIRQLTKATKLLDSLEDGYEKFYGFLA